MSSMFPDFLEFDGTQHRTPRQNPAITLIYQNNSNLQSKKNGTSISFLDLSQDATPLGLFTSHKPRTEGLKETVRTHPNPSVLVPAHKKSPIFRLSFFCEPIGTELELFFGRFKTIEPIERQSL